VVFVFESADTTSVSSVLKEAFGETVAPADGRQAMSLGEGWNSWHAGKRRVWRGVSGVRRDIEELRALKTIRRELLAERVARDAFKREALLWLSLDEHPFILSARWLMSITGGFLC